MSLRAHALRLVEQGSHRQGDEGGIHGNPPKAQLHGNNQWNIHQPEMGCEGGKSSQHSK